MGHHVHTPSLRVLVFIASVVLVACSVNVGKGGGKPAGPSDTSVPADGGKPVGTGKSVGPSREPAPERPQAEPDDAGPVRTADPQPDAGPVRTADPDAEPTRTRGEPTRVAGDPDDTPRAVCRATDEVLVSICQGALDPIAARDPDAFLASLSDDVTFVRPGPDGKAERVNGKAHVQRAMRAAGGLAELVHVRPGTRIVGTIVRDCRRCAKAYVSVQANTHAGRIIMTTDTASPPRVTQLELRADPRAAPARERGTR